MTIDPDVTGAEPHPFLADVGMVLAEFNGQPGRVLWYPAASLGAATLVVEAVWPGTIAIGNGAGDLAEIPVYEVNTALGMIRDQETWLRQSR